MVHLISYDLDGHERPSAYKRVREIIEANAISTRKALYSQWLVETSQSVAWWKGQLKPAIDDNDNLLVVRVFADAYSGWLNREIWDWLRVRA